MNKTQIIWQKKLASQQKSNNMLLIKYSNIKCNTKHSNDVGKYMLKSKNVQINE